MADGAYGQREIFIDLTVTGARVIRDATKNEHVKVLGIRVNGTAGGAQGDVVLRKESASGPEVFKLIAAASSSHDGTMALSDVMRPTQGLYMDSQGTAWAAGSHMIIYTA